MPSQLFDNGDGAYEVPSGERLKFTAGEGADASYDLPSAFQRAMTPGQSNKSAAMGSSDRFNSPGSYIKNTGGAPGPGAYTHQAQAKPSSRYGVMGPENTRASVDRLKFEGIGQGADAVYSVQSAFGDGSSPTKARGGAAGLGGSSKRFGAVNSYLAQAYSDAPGPGAYSAKAGQIQAGKKAGAPPPSRAAERLTFAPSSGMGESPGAAYKVALPTHLFLCACPCVKVRASFIFSPSLPPSLPLSLSPSLARSASMSSNLGLFFFFISKIGL